MKTAIIAALALTLATPAIAGTTEEDTALTQMYREGMYCTLHTDEPEAYAMFCVQPMGERLEVYPLLKYPQKYLQILARTVCALGHHADWKYNAYLDNGGLLVICSPGALMQRVIPPERRTAANPDPRALRRTRCQI